MTVCLAAVEVQTEIQAVILDCVNTQGHKTSDLTFTLWLPAQAPSVKITPLSSQLPRNEPQTATSHDYVISTLVLQIMSVDKCHLFNYLVGVWMTNQLFFYLKLINNRFNTDSNQEITLKSTLPPSFFPSGLTTWRNIPIPTSNSTRRQRLEKSDGDDEQWMRETQRSPTWQERCRPVGVL